MNKRIFHQRYVSALIGALLIPSAYADGSVSFHDNIVPMLKARAEFERFIT